MRPGTSAPKQKLVIKNLPQVPTVDKAELWRRLEAAFEQIFRRNSSQLSYEELHRTAYNLVLSRNGLFLYESVVALVRGHLQQSLGALAACQDEASFVQRLLSVWEEHCTCLGMYRDVLMYMDGNFCPANQRAPVFHMGVRLFLDVVVMAGELRARIREYVTRAVNRERCGEAVDRQSLRKLARMMLELGCGSRAVYVAEIEDPLLADARSFYRNESQLLISSFTCTEYLMKADARIREELQRVDYYLDAETAPRLRATVLEQMVVKHLETLLQSDNGGILTMVHFRKTDDIFRMYTLFKEIPHALKSVTKRICDDLLAQGSALVSNAETTRSADAHVDALMQLKRLYEDVYLKGFANNAAIRSEIMAALTKTSNMHKHCAEYLATFADTLLRVRIKGMSDDEQDAAMEEIMGLFRLLEDKDIFERFYKMLLARRLLHGRSASDDAEYLMISKLKMECGFQFTVHLERMFTDMKVSAELRDQFVASISRSGHDPMNGVDMYVKVLTSGVWPAQAVSSCVLPPELAGCAEAFRLFYTAKHTGRKLIYQLNSGTGDLRAHFPAKRCELNVSAFQMVVLLLFNERDHMTLADIERRTQVPRIELRRHLLSLCSPKVAILVNEGPEVFESSTVFSYNTAFKSKTFRVKVPLVKEEREESNTVTEEVLSYRRSIIDAAIVRIMKQRKRMEHSALVGEVLGQMKRFTPQPMDIKKRIETLIEREYLERSADDLRVYQYIS